MFNQMPCWNIETGGYKLKVKEIMDEEFIYVSPDQNIDEVSIIMEKVKKFTTPVVDKDIRLVGWITSFNSNRVTGW